jgi:hypothetical protein
MFLGQAIYVLGPPHLKDINICYGATLLSKLQPRFGNITSGAPWKGASASWVPSTPTPFESCSVNERGELVLTADQSDAVSLEHSHRKTESELLFRRALEGRMRILGFFADTPRPTNSRSSSSDNSRLSCPPKLPPESHPIAHSNPCHLRPVCSEDLLIAVLYL